MAAPDKGERQGARSPHLLASRGCESMKPNEKCCPAFDSDPLYNATATTRPVRAQMDYAEKATLARHDPRDDPDP
jgi:hypothetical protein